MEKKERIFIYTTKEKIIDLLCPDSDDDTKAEIVKHFKTRGSGNLNLEHKNYQFCDYKPECCKDKLKFYGITRTGLKELHINPDEIDIELTIWAPDRYLKHYTGLTNLRINADFPVPEIAGLRKLRYFWYAGNSSINYEGKWTSNLEVLVMHNYNQTLTIEFPKLKKLVLKYNYRIKN